MEVMPIGYGVVANIIVSHTIARGSIPRIRIFLLSVSVFIHLRQPPELDVNLYEMAQTLRTRQYFLSLIDHRSRYPSPSKI